VSQQPVRSLAKAMSASLCAMIAVVVTLTSDAHPHAQPQQPPTAQEQKPEYLLDGTWFEDTLIGAPIDAAWDERRTIAKGLVLSGL
jgi:hypothetical protein